MIKISISFLSFKSYAKTFVFVGLCIGLFLALYGAIQDVLGFVPVNEIGSEDSSTIYSLFALPTFFGIFGFISALLSYIPFKLVIKSKKNIEFECEFSKEI